MKTTVTHMRNRTGGGDEVRIDRRSKWGNPFVVGRDGTRAQVIDKYRQWFMTQHGLLEAVHELQGKTLLCWCKPLACHGDVLAAAADALGGEVTSSAEAETRAKRA